MSRSFSEDLLLTNATGKRLFEEYASQMPIIDYHCHLSPKEIYENRRFEDLGEMWLAGDHYKWRAMRVMGVDEKYITGSASYHEKFLAFAGIMPFLAGNPLYIWCALELKRFFGIEEALCSENAEEIYAETRRQIVEKNMTPRYCMELMKVDLVSTTEDPIDTLEYHLKMAADQAAGKTSWRTRVISALRPDKAMNIEKAPFADYLPKLEAAAAMKIDSFGKMIKAIEKRLQLFKSNGSTVSDAGMDNFSWEDASEAELDAILKKGLAREALSTKEINQWKSAFMLNMGRVYERNGFVMQIHIGAVRGVNTVMNNILGPDTGYDCIDNGCDIHALATLLDRLNLEGHLPKTILYPLNAADQEPLAVLSAAMCKGPDKGHVQLGAPWWFNDQVYGIERQFEACANLYPLAASVGMLTDSRSFLSYPRHELYRRVLCNYLGTLVERGEYFSDEKYLKKMVEDICYNNVKAFFGF